MKQFFGKSLDLHFGNFSVPVPYIQAAAVVFLLFLLILMIAQFRRHYVNWSVKGAIFGIFFGFLLALILEGFLIIGGRTAITEILGWKNAPKPIQVVVESGRTKLIQVLGVQEEIPSTKAYDGADISEAVETLQGLNPTDMKKVKSLICTP